MSKIEHTPGPWKMNIENRKSGVIFIDSSTESIARTFEAFSESEEAILTNIANARLVAAAPELLEICKDILPAFETLCKAQDIDLAGDNLFAAVYRNLLAAIAKATGEPHA